MKPILQYPWQRHTHWVKPDDHPAIAWPASIIIMKRNYKWPTIFAGLIWNVTSGPKQVLLCLHQNLKILSQPIGGASYDKRYGTLLV